MKFDPTKPIRTRIGYDAVIYKIYEGQEWPIHGAVKRVSGWVAESWRANGRRNEEAPTNCDLDLINTSELYSWWVNFYPDMYSYGYSTKEEADKQATSRRIACLRVEFKEGEGL